MDLPIYQYIYVCTYLCYLYVREGERGNKAVSRLKQNPSRKTNHKHRPRLIVLFTDLHHQSKRRPLMLLCLVWAMMSGG